MTSRNEVTGDMIVSRTANQAVYTSNWDKIFGKKERLCQGIDDSSYECTEAACCRFKKEALHCIWCQDDKCTGCTAGGVH